MCVSMCGGVPGWVWMSGGVVGTVWGSQSEVVGVVCSELPLLHSTSLLHFHLS